MLAFSYLLIAANYTFSTWATEKSWDDKAYGIKVFLTPKYLPNPPKRLPNVSSCCRSMTCFWLRPFERIVMEHNKLCKDNNIMCVVQNRWKLCQCTLRVPAKQSQITLMTPDGDRVRGGYKDVPSSRKQEDVVTLRVGYSDQQESLGLRIARRWNWPGAYVQRSDKASWRKRRVGCCSSFWL